MSVVGSHCCGTQRLGREGDDDLEWCDGRRGGEKYPDLRLAQVEEDLPDFVGVMGWEERSFILPSLPGVSRAP